MYRLPILLAASALSLTAIAGSEKEDSRTQDAAFATFETLDRNGDEQISKTEAAADKKVSHNFATLDANGDGYISKSEYAAHTKN